MNISTPFVIETNALSKTYKNIQALRSLDLKVHQNSIFGFLGPNGAGKTTTIKLLLGLIRPSAGRATVFGMDNVKQSVDIRARLVLKMGASDLVVLFLFFFAPLVIGLLVFHGPLLAFSTKKGYWRTILLRLPHTWITANLAIAGIFAIALPLVNISLQLPLRFWSVLFLWGLTVMCGLVAILLLFPYEIWSTRRGYRAWTILARSEGEVISAPWKKVWWWILLSYGVLVGGIACYTFIQQIVQR